MTQHASQIFISYRRDDTAGYARALNDALAQQFGADRVFIDVDDIGAGQAFDARIAQAMGQARVMDPRRFAADSQHLLGVLRQALGEPPPAAAPATAVPPTRQWPLAGAAVAAGMVVAAVAVAAWWLERPATPTAAGPTSAVAPAAAARPAINGRWQADVTYDWPGARYNETLDLQGSGTALQGTASFLRVPRGIEGGQVDGQTVRFATRSSEALGSGPERVVTHRYSGTLVGDTLQLTMQTEGAAQPHRPVAVTARRSAP
jgi:TIR domain